VINQLTGPANPGDILYLTRVTLFITLLCIGYSLSRPTPAGNQNRELFLIDTSRTGSKDRQWTSLPSWQRKASEKAIERYTATQDKKWRRWNEAMFERSN